MGEHDDALVAIVMATYNGGPYVAEQVASIQAQTHARWRLLVSDDGSTDGTDAEVVRLAEGDGRIRVVLDGQTFGSAQRHFMALLGEVGTDADYVLFCDQDDVWDADKVERELREMRRAEREAGAGTPVLVCTDLRVVDGELGLVAPSMARYQHLPHQAPPFCRLLVENMVTGCTVMVNRALLELARATPAGAQMVMHDWWLALVAAGLGELRYLDEPTVSYRQHGHNTLGAAHYAPGAILRSWNWAEQCDNMRGAILQARAFREVFGARLDAGRRARLDHFCALVERPRVRRVGHLLASHAWKTGVPRRIGEFIGIVFSRRV